MLSIGTMLIISAAIAFSGITATILSPKIKTYNARVKTERERRENDRLEQERAAGQERRHQAELDAKREERLRDEEARIREEENTHIKSNPAGYLDEQRALILTDPEYNQNGHVAARASEAIDNVTAEISRTENSLRLPAALASIFSLVWLGTVTTNAIFTGLVMFGIMGKAVWIVAPIIVIAPSILIQLVRVNVDRYQKGTIKIQALIRSASVCAASVLFVGLVLFSSAGSRADYLYSDKIEYTKLEIEQEKAEFQPDNDRIALLKQSLNSLDAKRSKAEDLFKGILPISLALECLTAYFLIEFRERLKLANLRAVQRKNTEIRNAAQDAQNATQMESINRTIARMSSMGLYTNEILHRLGLRLQNGNDTPNDTIAETNDQNDGNPNQNTGYQPDAEDAGQADPGSVLVPATAPVTRNPVDSIDDYD